VKSGGGVLSVVLLLVLVSRRLLCVCVVFFECSGLRWAVAAATWGLAWLGLLHGHSNGHSSGKCSHRRDEHSKLQLVVTLKHSK